MAESFQERIARRRAAFEAEWQRDHGPRTLTNDDPINPHKHVADTERGTQCMARTDGLCFIAHDCRCPILFACMGGCYRTEAWRSYHPNRPVQFGPQLPYGAVAPSEIEAMPIGHLMAHEEEWAKRLAEATETHAWFVENLGAADRGTMDWADLKLDAQITHGQYRAALDAAEARQCAICEQPRSYANPLEQRDLGMTVQWMHRYACPPKPESVDCTECEQTFAIQPADFIRYDRWRDRWVTASEEDGTVLPLHGVCGPCQRAIEASRDVYGGRGHERVEQRTIEDEQYVWER